MMPDRTVPTRGTPAYDGVVATGPWQVNIRAISHNKFDALERLFVRQGPDWV